MKTFILLAIIGFVLFLFTPPFCQRAAAGIFESGSVEHLVALEVARRGPVSRAPAEPEARVAPPSAPRQWEPAAAVAETEESEEEETRAEEPEVRPSPTRVLSRQREAFAQIIHEFRNESDELKEVLEEGTLSLETFRSAIREARDRDAEFDRVYRDWEQVSANTDALKRQFENLVEGAADFYATAEAHAKTIHKKALRKDSLDYIENSQSSYLKRLNETKLAIQQVDAMKVSVDDTMKALEIRFAVDIVDQRIVEIFEQIDQMVADVLQALNDLEVENQQVLGQFG